MILPLIIRQRIFSRDRRTFVAALCLLVVFGAPAAIEAGGPSVTIGVPVQFTDQSSHGPSTWVWDFDYDGANVVVRSTAQNPMWTFDEARTYQVYLEVCNASGCNETVKAVEAQEEAAPDLIFESSFESGNLLDWSFQIP